MGVIIYQLINELVFTFRAHNMDTFNRQKRDHRVQKKQQQKNHDESK